jgi:deazaflavin-dependent oxidoreductase (nitroreductase family)
MFTEKLRTRIEHEVDTRSVRFGVWMYRITRGRVVRLWRRRAIVLTTTGRRSAQPRTVLVQVFQDGADLLVVAANSGLPRPPGWYFNLRAEPRLDAELDGQRLRLRAELLPEAAAAERWSRVVLTAAPDYERYERRTGQVPPIFRLVAD